MRKVYLEQIKMLQNIIVVFELLTYFLLGIIYYIVWSQEVSGIDYAIQNGAVWLLLLAALSVLCALSITWRTVFKNLRG